VFAAGLGQELALFPALMLAVRDGSSWSAAGRDCASGALTRNNGRRRTVVDEVSALAKVGVAGSNPVVRSER
jgi:hypothetical protein